MERNVLWRADDCSFTVLVRHGIRVVNTFRAESLGDSAAEMRMQAAVKALELAIEYRIELRNVSEAIAPLD